MNNNKVDYYGLKQQDAPFLNYLIFQFWVLLTFLIF